MKQWAEFHWHTRTGKTKVIVTDEPQVWYSKLKNQNEFFVCYPMKAQIPKNKS